jgi:hypothetical protein
MTTTSFKNVSVGVGLALESIATPTIDRIAPDREIPTSPLLGNVEYICFDIFSLCGDVLSSIRNFNKNIHDEDFVIERVKEMIESIKAIPELQGIVKFINTTTYLIANKSLVKEFREGTKSEIQRKILMRALFKIPTHFDYEKNTFALERNTLFFSNNVYWLAILKNLKGHALVLESHTGNVLTEITLNKKYKKSKLYDNTKLPFDALLLKFLGDGNFINGLNHKEISDLITHMNDNWTPITSRNTISKYMFKNHGELYAEFK